MKQVQLLFALPVCFHSFFKTCFSCFIFLAIGVGLAMPVSLMGQCVNMIL